MTNFQSPELLQKHRYLLLACEAIGWLHMTGKANIKFLHKHGGQKTDYRYEDWNLNEAFNKQLQWLKDKHKPNDNIWPKKLTEFINKHTQSDKGLLGLLQAGHGIASGIEKNLPKNTSKYLGQDITHMWLSSAFGHPIRNLLADPPEILSEYCREALYERIQNLLTNPPVLFIEAEWCKLPEQIQNLIIDLLDYLTESGWKRLHRQIESLLNKLKILGNSQPYNKNNIRDEWWQWRDKAIGPDGWLRKAFTSTLAETRLPSNDVTLFDQSYVAATLFKSAAAGAILEENKFPWSDKELEDDTKLRIPGIQVKGIIKKVLKQHTQWRLLTVGIGADHYEARAVKIGDWTGARLAIEDFFMNVCKLIEVDLAIGSLLYSDEEICVFSFPGERFGYGGKNYKGTNLNIDEWQQWLTSQIDSFAKDAKFETPPYCNISEPSRSLIKMTEEIQKARETMAVPLHRNWQIPEPDSSDRNHAENKKKTESKIGHVCPVCLVRCNGSQTDKQKLCKPCKNRRTHRLDNWLTGKFRSDTIWIDEVADAHDRVALVTMSLDIEPWLDGTRLDTLRAQAISEWLYKNSELRNIFHSTETSNFYESFFQYIKKLLDDVNNDQIKDSNDIVLRNLQDGFQHEKKWSVFFSKIVEDRTDAPKWDDIDNHKRAAWITHQLFRKLASSGRIYRFHQQAEGFFKSLLNNFRQTVSIVQNRWREQRLIIKPSENSKLLEIDDRTIFSGRYREAPITLMYRKKSKDFLTICNLARILEPEESKDSLKDVTLTLKAENSEETIKLTVGKTENITNLFYKYDPVIPLDLSPVRFRVLLPLEAASACVDKAVETWKNQFARVWDRLPLRVGVVAFLRMTPFQAVIEAVRSIEAGMDKTKNPETWRVLENGTREGVSTLCLNPLNQRQELLQTVPIKLPDGREDVFYPYLTVEDKQIRFPLDFKHPDGRVFRHAKDLQRGDGIHVYPALITTLFLNNNARRFEPICRRYLMEWRHMTRLWQLIDQHAPSQVAIRSAWSDIIKRREAWQGPDGKWLEGGEVAWLDFARMVFHERLGIRGACLEQIVTDSSDGLLEWALDWHISILKQKVTGGEQ